MFLLNEISLHSQFQSEADFTVSLKDMLECRELLRTYQRALHCNRATLGDRKILGQIPFRKAIGNLVDKNIQRAVFSWVDKDGPFWEDEKLHSSDEYFYDKKDEPVTDTALAEAAFRVFNKMDSTVVSFSPSDYLFSPLIIKWHRDSSDVLEIQISNYWQIQLLSSLLAELQPALQSWNQLIDYAKAHFGNLVFLPDFESKLKSQPFNLTIANQAIVLLGVVNELKVCFDDNGRRTKRGDEIIETYFKGDRAKFSDESDVNKIRFEKDLTFKKADGANIFCPYHGKISHETYRLHMSWPVTKSEPLFIAYLGQKITKK